jgi:hypothetical protein
MTDSVSTDGGGGGFATRSDEEPDEVHMDTAYVQRLQNLVRRFVEIDDEIRELKEVVRPTQQRIRELGVQRREISVVVATIMGANSIDRLNPNIDGAPVGSISRVQSKRYRPTVAALETTLLEEVYQGNREALEALRKRALLRCDPPKPSLRRSRRRGGGGGR